LLSAFVHRQSVGIKNSRRKDFNAQPFSPIHSRPFLQTGASPKNVAEEHKVSTRTLHSIFAKAKSSFGQELLALRMDRANHLFRDPRFNNKSIAEIGVLVGLPTKPFHDPFYQGAWHNPFSLPQT